MRFIANHNQKTAHILVSVEPLRILCGKEIKPRKFYYVDQAAILDFMSTKERRRLPWRERYKMCYFCARKLDQEKNDEI